MKVAYLTTAQQGAGHFTRGVAIERGLRRQGYRGEFRLFTPPLPYPIEAHFDYTHTFTLTAGEALHPERAREGALAQALLAYAPDLLIVDLYWYAVHHILAALDCECWLLLRCCPKNWFAPRTLETPGGTSTTAFDPSMYRRVVSIEPLRFDATTDMCSPIVVCNPDECRPPFDLRRRLKVPSGHRLVMITHAGLEGEHERLHQDALPGDVVAGFSLFDPGSLYPVAEWLSGADVIYSGAGYNSFWESRWLGYDDRAHFTAFDRKNDWQEWRLEHCRTYPMKANGADELARWILALRPNLLTRVVRGLSRRVGGAQNDPPKWS